MRLPTALLCLFAMGHSALANSLTVDLGYSVYQGSYDATTGLNVWKGIRYAAPPTGNNRWQAPKVPAVNRTVQSATQFASICPQNYPSIPNPPFIPGNEDCLFLNVYAPSSSVLSRGFLPVMVWIHGGGYGFGDGTQDMSEIINANNDGFIAVTIQYRLGAFGFLSSQEVHERGIVNAGILDQAFALQWVQKYILLFGGDPTQVTISGESAGAGSVMYHALAYGGKQLATPFKNGIAASPYLQPQYPYNATVPTGHYYDFATKAGCPSTGNVFDCLVSKDTMTLQFASSNVSTSQTYGTWAFLPVTDYRYIQMLPSQQLLAKKVNGVRMLVGNNADEGALFVPPTIVTLADLTGWLGAEFPTFTSAQISQILAAYPSGSGPVNASDPKYYTSGFGPGTAINISGVATGQQQRGNNIYAEATFVCPSYWLASAFSGPGNAAYHYQYSVPFAMHQADIPGYFGPATPNQGPDFQLAFRTIWGNFITNNNPSISNAIANGASSSNPNAPNGASTWPTWNDVRPMQLNLNETGGVPYTFVTQFGASVTQFQEPGLKNSIALVDASAWEGGRGQRCQFWRNISPSVPQ